MVGAAEILNFLKVLSTVIGLQFVKDRFSYYYFLAKGTKVYRQDKLSKYSTIKSPFYPNKNAVDLYRYYIKANIYNTEKKLSIDIENFENLFLDSNLVIVNGPAGIGKSTFAKDIFLKSKSSCNLIPVIIEFKNLENCNNPLVTELLNSGPTNNKYVLNKLFQKNNLLIILDGFDELSSEYEKSVINEIEMLSETHSKNKFLITSRPYYKLNSLTHFSHYSICPLNRSQFQDYIYKYYGDDHETPSKLVTELHALERSSFNHLLELFKTPLILTIFLYIYKSTKNIPKSRHELYENIVDALIKTHDESKSGGFDREYFSEKGDFIYILREFSLISLFEEKSSFKIDCISIILNKIKPRHPQRNHVDHESFAHDCVTSTSFWIKDGLQYFFAHKSIQEFLACQAITLSEDKPFAYQLLNTENENPILRKNYNFLSLLEELDRPNFNKFFFIPNAKYLLDLLDHENELKVSRNLMLFTTKGLRTYSLSEEDRIQQGGYRAMVIADELAGNFNHIASRHLGAYIDYFQSTFSDYAIEHKLDFGKDYIFSEHPKIVSDLVPLVRNAAYPRAKALVEYLKTELSSRH